MSVQFKFRERVTERRRKQVVAALGRAGFDAETLFPGQKRASLASIFTVEKADDVAPIEAALGDYRRDIEYVERAPQRSPKR
jgi:hypothetical protein